MTSPLPSRRRLFWRTLLAWDLGLSLAAAVALAVGLFTSERDLEDTTSIVAAAIPYGIAIATASVVSLRWVTDRLKDSEYGRLVRAGDPEERAVSIPFYVVTGVGLLCSLLGLTLVTLVGETSRGLTALLLTILFFLAVYGLLGTVSLFGIAARHQRNSARMQRIREDAQRDLREAARKRAGPQEDP